MNIETPINAFPAPRPTRVRPDSEILLPPLLLAALMVLTCGWISFRIPFAPLLSILWPLALLAAIGIVGWRPPVLVSRGAIVLSALALLTTWLVLADVDTSLIPFKVISHHPDAWSYESMADYFLHFHRGERGAGLPMIDQFGSSLRNTRFGAATALAFLSRAPFIGSAAAAHGMFYALCLVVHFYSFTCFMRALEAPWSVAALGGALGTAGGWMTNLLTIGNYDNLLFLAMAPALIGLMVRFERRTVSKPVFVIGGGVLLAALSEVYPEGTALLSLLAFPLVVQLCLRCVFDRRIASALIGMAILALLLSIPYLRVLIPFMRSQYAIGTALGAVARPGSGNFPGLLGLPWLPAVFALGEELPKASFSEINLATPLFLFLSICAGCHTLFERNRWFPWTAWCLLGLALWQGAMVRYDYGLYKVLICASWWIYSAAAFGIWRLVRRLNAYPPLGAVFIILFAASIAVEKWEDVSSRVWQSNYSLAPVEELKQIDQRFARAPILLDVDDDFEFLWATLFLRNHPLGAIQLRSYYGMPHIVIEGMPRPESCRYVLVSGIKPGAVWQNDRFSLLPNEGARILNLQNPQGVEPLNKCTFIWLGSKQATVTIYAMQAGDYFLRGCRMVLGPSCPTNSVSRTVELHDASGTRETILNVSANAADEPPQLPIHLASGLNRVTMRDLDPVTPRLQSRTDPRELLLGIEGLNVSGRVASGPSGK